MQILFHVTTSYGVSEPTALRIVRHVEDCLIKANRFNISNLPEGEGIEWNMVIVDATETPIQRSKKQKKSYGAKERPILLEYRLSFIIKLKKY